MSKKKETSIPNWTFYGAKLVVIDLNYFEEEDESWYNPIITFVLDNGKEDFDAGISIITEISEECKGCALSHALEGLGSLFETVSAITTVYNGNTGEVIEELNLNEFMQEHSEDEELEVEPKINYTVH